MTEKMVQDRKRWQKVFDETFPSDGVNVIFVQPEDEPEGAYRSFITPRLMVIGVEPEDDRPWVAARPVPDYAPAVAEFKVLAIEDYPSSSPYITTSKMLILPMAEEGQERVWVVNLHAEGARRACLETRRGPTGYMWGDAWFDDELRDRSDEEMR